MGGINYFEGKYNLFYLIYNKIINFINRIFFRKFFLFLLDIREGNLF